MKTLIKQKKLNDINTIIESIELTQLLINEQNTHKINSSNLKKIESNLRTLNSCLVELMELNNHILNNELSSKKYLDLLNIEKN